MKSYPSTTAPAASAPAAPDATSHEPPSTAERHDCQPRQNPYSTRAVTSRVMARTSQRLGVKSGFARVSRFPSRQREANHAEHAPARQPGGRIAERVRHPDAGQGRANQKEHDRYGETDLVDGGQPAPRELARGAGAIALHEHEGKERDRGQQRDQRDADDQRGVRSQRAPSAAFRGRPLRCPAPRSRPHPSRPDRSHTVRAPRRQRFL